MSQEILVGFGSTVVTRDFNIGSRFTQVGNTSAEGNIVKSLGSIKINTSATESWWNYNQQCWYWFDTFCNLI